MENKCESESCGCSKSDTQNQCCGQQECGCNSSGNCCNEYDKIAMLMYVAKKAKMELLKEKIKKRLESLEGKKLDQTADLVVEAMMDCHKNKMDIEKKQQDMREKFEAIFSKD